MDDWQETVFTSRHVHNRSGKGHGRGRKNQRSGSGFDVRNMFGTYELKCPRATAAVRTRAPSQGGEDGDDVDNGRGEIKPTRPQVSQPCLTIHRLSENREGLVGEITIPGVIQATAVLSGSRKSLARVVEQIEKAEVRHMAEQSGSEPAANPDEGLLSANAGEASPHDHDVSSTPTANNTFEKNTFRTPKWWVRWQGLVAVGLSTPQPGDGTGYLVFSGQDCRKFHGTLSCDALSWDNVSATGWKLKSAAASDKPVQWNSQPAQ